MTFTVAAAGQVSGAATSTYKGYCVGLTVGRKFGFFVCYLWLTEAVPDSKAAAACITHAAWCSKGQSQQSTS
jgi:hypothetical protein